MGPEKQRRGKTAAARNAFWLALAMKYS